MAVRSRRFFGPTAVAASTTALLYTVPADRVARFSLVTCVLVGAGTGDHFLRVNSTTGQHVERFSAALSLRWSFLQGMVLNPADELYIVTPATSTAFVAGFGSLLEGAPS